MLNQIIFFLFILVNNIYSYTIPSLDQRTINFGDFSGKKILIVNVSSQSKYNTQLVQLDSLQQLHGDSLVVVVVPSNSFNNEPLDNGQLKGQMSRYHFKVAAKSEVTGSNQVDLYKWLTTESSNERFGSVVKDDYQKYLIDENGMLMGIFRSSVNPLGNEIERALQVHLY